MSDEFDDIFEDLNPEDFSTPVQTGGTLLPHNDLDFEEFVNQHLLALRRAFSKVGMALTMVAYLAVEDRQWSFGPTVGESIDSFLERLHIEAQMLGAKMLFVHRRTKGGHVEVGLEEDVPAPTDPAAYQRVLDAGVSRDVMFYFAQCKHGSLSEYRHGVMYIEDGQLGDPQEGATPNLRGFPYAQILR